MLGFQPKLIADPLPFSTTKKKVAILGYLRRNLPQLYQDFVLRYDALDFFDVADQAISKLGFKGESVPGLEISVLDSAEAEFKVGNLNLESFDQDIVEFIHSYPHAHDANVLDALRFELKRASLVEGLTTGIILSEVDPSLKRIFKLPFEDRMKALTKIISPIAMVPNLDPHRVGLSRDHLSGPEFLKFYEESERSRLYSLRLIWLAVLAQERQGFSLTVQDMAQITPRLSEQDFYDAFNQAAFLRNSQKFIDAFSEEFSPSLTEPKIRKAFQASYSAVKGLVLAHAEQKELPVLNIATRHPYEVFLRGGVGDCSTFNSAVISLAKKESISWLRRNDKSVKGYLQTTHVLTDEGEQALYVNTISGAEVSRVDVQRVLLALFENFDKLGVSHLVIPAPEKLNLIINYPEVELIFRQLGLKGRRIALHYADSEERQTLAPFIEDSLDLPETNEFGIEIFREQLENKGVTFVTRAVELKAADLFPKLSRDEALIIALELRNRETAQSAVTEILNSYHIAEQDFSTLWRVLNNENHLPVRAFHLQLQEAISTLKLPLDWTDFQHLPLLFRGHFAAPDALTYENFSLAMEYVTEYLGSFTDLKYVYTTLAPRFATLQKSPIFISLIRSLFRKNLKELRRLLDSYELENRSAYRTIASLFEAGLSTEPFKLELSMLDRPLENDPAYVERKDDVYVRRKTLLGMIEAQPNGHFYDLMNFLETLARTTQTLEEDDVRAVSNYFATFINRPDATSADIARINDFLISSDFGLGFTSSLGMFKIDRLNVHALVERLFAAQKFYWAARLIHKDPWPQDKLSPYWLKVLWEHRADVTDAAFLEGLKLNPSWLAVDGINPVLDGLLSTSRKDVGSEAVMTRLLLKDSRVLTHEQAEWLGQVSTEGLAELVLNLSDDKRVRSQLRDRFPGVQQTVCKNILSGGLVGL